MDHRTPLSMSEAEAFWLRRRPALLGETVNYLRRAPLTRTKSRAKAHQAIEPETVRRARPALNFTLARKALVTNERLHEDIVQELGARFFRKVGMGKIWAGTQIVLDKRTKEKKEVLCVECWLSRVHKRVVWHFARSEARQYLYRNTAPAHDDDGDEAFLLPGVTSGQQPSSEELGSLRETLSDLEPRIRRLPERERQIFLRHVCGDSYQEIAIALDITEAAARTSVHRTRKKLI
jgi:hypothetical protein